MRKYPISRAELGRRLCEAREVVGMSLDEVAVTLGMSRASMCQIEAGKRQLSGFELAQLAYLYGRAEGDFFESEWRKDDPAALLIRLVDEAVRDAEVKRYAEDVGRLQV